MVAKIKDRNPYGQGGHRHKPKGLKDREFEQVYWPFLPVLIAATVLLGLAAQTGSLASYLKHPTGRVLAYASSRDINGLLFSTNYQRQSNSQPDLTLNDQLTKAAQAKANDMVARNYWSHYTPDGEAPWIFVTGTGYSYQKLGENLATGFTDEQSVVKAWMASLPHRENLLDPNYTQVGFGFADAPDYRAAGGGPMTVVVAYYGLPKGVTNLVASSQDSKLAASTANPQPPATLAAQTVRAELAFSKYQASSWGPIAVALILVGLIALVVAKHTKSFRIALRKGERFVWRHPLLDLGVLVMISFLVILAQTAGYIQ